MLSLLGLAPHLTAASTVGFLGAAYLSGLLVHARGRVRTFDFIEDGGLKGDGYLKFFRCAERSLFLTHVDDDPPGEELLALYRSLLERGVQMRRVIFRRALTSPVQWVVDFGEHKNLTQRVVCPEQAELMAFSFAIVDEELVLISVPGYGAIDVGPYAPRFVLRHLLVLHDRTVARVFLEIHRQLWEHARSLENLKALVAPTAKSRRETT